MTNDKQVQKSGDHSVQTQVGQQTINYYIINTAEEARGVFDEMGRRAAEESFARGFELGQNRINAFAEVVIPKIQEIDEKFQSFSDPAFQILLKKAQITAACSDRNADYGILSELLVHRIKNKENIKKKASIAKAVEIIDQIDDDSLCGLTVFLAVQNFIPATGNISEGLKVLNDLYSKLELGDLPTDDLWIDHLSMLNAINVIPFTKLIKFEELLARNLDGFVCVGIEKGSLQYNQAIEILDKCSIDHDILVDHELMNGYVRLALSEKGNSEQRIYFETIYKLYSNDEEKRKEVVNKFENLLHSFPSIKRISDWWNTIEQHIKLTSIGKVIAYTNAKRYDSTLPDLD